VKEGKERKEVEFPRGCCAVKWPQNMKPLQGAGRGDIQEKERERSMREREKRGGGKCERRGMRNIQRPSRK